MSFPLDLPQMPIEQIVGNRHKLLVPVWIAGLVAAEQKQRRAPRIKRIQHPQVAFLHFAPQLLHVGVAGSGNHVGMRPGQRRAALLQQFNLGADLDLFIFGKGVPLGLKLAGELDLPCHVETSPYKE